MSRLETVFQKLIEVGLKLKPSKCKLLRKSVSFLGHVVSAEGLSTNPEKVRSIAEFPVPRDVERLKSFLGLSGYYRDFVPNYADIARPLTLLNSECRDFVWSGECQDSFEQLKQLLMMAPVLAYPDFSKTFILTTDASDKGLGAILSQEYGGRARVVWL